MAATLLGAAATIKQPVALVALTLFAVLPGRVAGGPWRNRTAVHRFAVWYPAITSNNKSGHHLRLRALKGLRFDRCYAML
jgi:hypothetical protein